MMTQSLIHNTFEESVLLPKIFSIGEGLYAASFFLMKLLPAKFILDVARRENKLSPGSIVIETTSGTFGLALAMLCNRYSYRCILVSDPVLDPLLRNRIEGLGTVVDVVDKPAKVGGFQKSRLDRLHKHLEQNKGSFCPQQYENLANPGSYALLAEYLSTAFGQIDCLVGTVGSGGSICGTSMFLRKVNPEMRVIGVDTVNSILFGQPDGKRIIRGLGNSIMPDILDHSVFDEVHWLTAQETFASTREIHKKHGLFLGVTSGAAYRVAKHWAAKHPEQTTVFICPDEGYRYLDSAFDNKWLAQNGLNLDDISEEPQVALHPGSDMRNWTMVHWNRRKLDEVQSFEVVNAGVAV